METNKILLEVGKVLYKKDGFYIIKGKQKRNDFDFSPSIDPTFLINFPTPLQSEDIIEVEGYYEKSEKYGYNFIVNICKRIKPQSHKFMIEYIVRFTEKVGKITAKKIVDLYGLDSLDKIKENIENLTVIKGINEKRAKAIQDMILYAEAYEESIVFLLSLNLSVKKSFEVFDKYTFDTIETVKRNPYNLLEINNISFKVVDKIAKDNTEQNHNNNPERIKASILYYLSYYLNTGGDLYKNEEDITENLNEFLNKNSAYSNNNIDFFDILFALNTLKSKENCKVIEEDNRIYLQYYNYVENSIVELIDEKLDEVNISYTEEKIEDLIDSGLNNKQKNAVKMALNNTLSILTGLPGTGKTYTVNQIIKVYSKLFPHHIIQLLAPTGKAAKRMTEVSGIESSTIHRALKLSNFDEDDTTEELDGDFIIIDETSMVDAYVFFKLMENVKEGAKVLLVGDYNQLPSVGAGLILRDLIKSEMIETVNLDEIYRQGKDSNIVLNSHRLIKGENMEFNNKEYKDFYFIEKNNDVDIQQTILKSVNNLINNKGFKLEDIQILTPMKKGDAGSFEINNKIQQLFNKKTNVFKHYSKTFKVNDKVIQTENNYDLEVFNGEIGNITFIDDSVVIVDYGNKEVEYTEENISEIELAYSITIHKSQGSEFPVVIIPITSSAKILNYRNLLYTGITRAKEIVVLVGEREELIDISGRIENLNRNSNIVQKLRELGK